MENAPSPLLYSQFRPCITLPPLGSVGDFSEAITVYVFVGDIGGTNTRLALYRDGKEAFERIYPSQEQASLEDAALRFLQEARAELGNDVRPQRACFGVAGPVENDTSKITNLPWFIEARKLEQRLQIERVRLLNDFQAAALGVTVLEPQHFLQLGGGTRVENGPCVVLGAGTGLGAAFLIWSTAGRYEVVSSEAGHTDFAARTPVEAALYQHLVRIYERVSYERVLSGAGLVDTFQFLDAEYGCHALVRPETREAMKTEDPAAVVTKQALAGADPVCRMAVEIFLSVLGGFAGNLALTALATGGVFIAGGITPRLKPLLNQGPFRPSFEAKGRMQPLVAKMPAYLVMFPDLGMLGASVQASRL
ncbi:MAG TPA: glucokinase [Polyangia bacterium]